MQTRRSVILSAAAAVALSAVPARASSAVSAASRKAGPVRLTLPAPSGPHPVGTVSLHLVDASRSDP